MKQKKTKIILPDEVYSAEMKQYLSLHVDLTNIDLDRLHGLIYFAVKPDLSLVKIGYSGNLRLRFSAMKGDHPKYRDLILWSCYPGKRRFRDNTSQLPLLLVEEGCHHKFAEFFILGRPDLSKPRRGSYFPSELFYLKGELRDFVLGMPRLGD